VSDTGGDRVSGLGAGTGLVWDMGQDRLASRPSSAHSQVAGFSQPQFTHLYKRDSW
jgi:hypothetical protein